MMKIRIPNALALSLALAFTGTVFAADQRIVQVNFDRGASETTMTDRIKGSEYVVYKLGASDGQFLRVSLRPDNHNTGFNIYIPGRGPGDDALYNSETGGKPEYYGQLYKDGVHSVSVFQNRNAARKGAVSNFEIHFEIRDAPRDTGSSRPAPSDDSDDPATDASVRAGNGKFDATGKVPCAQGKGMPMSQCKFGVARASSGTATVVITRPDGRNRAIFFRDGNATSADTSQADGYPEFKARKEADLYHIRLGDSQERYEIPEAVVTGG